MQGLIETGRDFHHRGWSLATSSNYSVVTARDPLRLLVTCSGFDKGRLTPEQFVMVGENGKCVCDSGRKPSAEVLLHVALARYAQAGSVLHTHSIWGTLLSEAGATRGYVEISGYEMLKALAGITTHEVTVRVEVFSNTQDIPDLACRLAKRLRDPGRPPFGYAFLIAGHGLYAWGKDLTEARRHIEALEFLFEVVARKGWLFATISSGSTVQLRKNRLAG
ncbi:MAG: methylthioribulose 1-phosphate dehydratase [Verrucomicrobia bacterium]|nr:methylthioribulose 1-phosphate dehydratase [Verrucomicrobiota bacterium]